MLFAKGFTAPAMYSILKGQAKGTLSLNYGSVNMT